MRQSTARNLIVHCVALGLISMGWAHSSAGAIVTTRDAIQLEQRAQRIDRIQVALARDDVRARLVALGVDPVHAGARVQALSDAELVFLETHLEALPAGAGAIEILGVVFLVLLVLELVGVIDIFNKI